MDGCHGMDVARHAHQGGHDGDNQNRKGARRHQDGGDFARHGVRVHGNRGHGHNQRQGHRAVGGGGEGLPPGEGPRLGVEAQRDGDDAPAHGDKQADEATEHAGVGKGGREVYARPGDDKEDGNQEALADALYALLQVLVAIGKDGAQDEAGCKGAQHDVQVEGRREGDEKHQQKDRQPKEDVGGGTGAVLDEAVDVGAGLPRGAGQKAQHQADGHKDHQDDGRGAQRPGRQQKSHGQDRQDLACGPVGRYGVAHRRARQAALAHDGGQGPIGGGGEGDGKGQTADAAETLARQDEPGKGQANGDGDKPGQRGVGARFVHELAGLNLKASHEEEKAQTQLGEHLEGFAIRLDPAQHVGPQDGAGKDEEDHLGHRLARDEAGQEGGQKGHEQDDTEGYELGFH